MADSGELSRDVGDSGEVGRVVDIVEYAEDQLGG